MFYKSKHRLKETLKISTHGFNYETLTWDSDQETSPMTTRLQPRDFAHETLTQDFNRVTLPMRLVSRLRKWDLDHETSPPTITRHMQLFSLILIINLQSNLSFVSHVYSQIIEHQLNTLLPQQYMTKNTIGFKCLDFHSPPFKFCCGQSIFWVKISWFRSWVKISWFKSWV